MVLKRGNFPHVALANLTRKRVSFWDLTIMHGRGQEGLTNQVPFSCLTWNVLYVGPSFVAHYLCVLLELPGKKKVYIFVQVLDQIQYHVKGNSFQMNHTVHTSYFIIRVLYYFLLFYLFVIIQCCDQVHYHVPTYFPLWNCQYI